MAARLLVLLFLSTAVFAHDYLTLRMNRETVHKSVGSMLAKASKVRGRPFPPQVLGASEDVDLYGDVFPVAIFWFYISVGTPPVQFPVAIDTGSFTLDVQEVACQGCPTTPPNTQYYYKNSSTSVPKPCGIASGCTTGGCDGNICAFSNTYETCDLSDPTAPCTIKGHLYSDQVSIQGAGPVDVTFGAINYQTDNFDQFKYICGVMGISGPADNQNVFATLVQQKYLPQNQFGICLHQGSKSNGTMTLGGLEPNLASGPFVAVKNVGYPMYYEMHLNNIKIGGTTVADTSDTTAILDSGTNILLVPTPAYNSFATILKNNCTANPLVGVCNTTTTIFDGACFPLTQAQIDQYPPIEVVLDGLTLVMTGKDYVVPRDDPTQYCIGIAPTGATGFLIIGDTTMQNYYVAFDNDAQTISWAPVNTSLCGSL